ncbi:hypothetical protein AGMMS49938_04550 [Fibrobacterales bacterium]|nr:hypothetical protein AGMMS49938_04550 [Fibrobacterales bacterium]
MHRKKPAAKTADRTSAKHPVFAPLTLDFTFKKAFAGEKDKDLLAFLLNIFLERVLASPIADVKIIHTSQLGKTRKNRSAIFDIHCEDASGARFIVEMQVAEQEHFIKRTFYYLCMSLANIAKKGDGHKYDFPKIYTLSFLEFDLDFGTDCNEVIQYLSVANDLHREVRYNFMQMVYVVLARFDKTKEECKTNIDKMLFVLKNVQNLKGVPKNFMKNEIKRIFEIAKISNFTEEESMFYDQEMKYKCDQAAIMAFAKKKATEEGMQQGMQQGMRQGLVLSAKNMLASGYNPDEVSRITKLPKKEILALRH